MPTLQEIDTTFRQLIAEQEALLAKLKAEKADNARQRHEYKAIWRQAVVDFFDARLAEPNRRVLRRLGKASKRLDNPIDFIQALRGMVEDSRAARHLRTELIARHGNRDDLERKYEDHQAALKQKIHERDALHTKARKIEDDFEAILDFNDAQTQKGLKRLLPKNREYFETNSVKSWIKSKTYRRGRKLLKQYAKKTGKNFFEQYEKLADLKTQLRRKNTVVGTMETIADGQSALLRRLDDLSRRIKTDAQIAEEIRELVIGLMEDRNFFDAVVKEYKSAFPQEAVVIRAKSDCLKQVAVNMGRRVDMHQKTIDQLSNAINSTKFRRGLRRKPSHHVPNDKIDLNKISQQVRSQTALSALHINGIHALRHVVKDFDRNTALHKHLTGDRGGLVGTTNLLILAILLSDDTDDFITSHNLTIPANVASAAGIDLSDLHLDPNGLDRLDTLGISAKELGLDSSVLNDLDMTMLEQMDLDAMGSNDFDTGIETMPDLSIDIPPIDFPTIDPSGGGGFDSGGF